MNIDIINQAKDNRILKTTLAHETSLLSNFHFDANKRGSRKCHFCGKLKVRKDRIDYDDIRKSIVPSRKMISYLKRFPGSMLKMEYVTCTKEITVICCKECYHIQLDKSLQEVANA